MYVCLMSFDVDGYMIGFFTRIKIIIDDDDDDDEMNLKFG